MPKSTQGVLITIDIATKIYLESLKEFEEFTIMEIDDRHLFIKESKLDLVMNKVTEFKEKYNYEKPKEADKMRDDWH